MLFQPSTLPFWHPTSQFTLITTLPKLEEMHNAQIKHSYHSGYKKVPLFWGCPAKTWKRNTRHIYKFPPPQRITHNFCRRCISPASLLLTAQAVLISFPPRAGVGASDPLDTAAGFLSAFIVASNEVSASSGNGARRLDERPCLRVWVSLSRRKRFDIRLHQDWKESNMLALWGTEIEIADLFPFKLLILSLLFLFTPTAWNNTLFDRILM